MNLYLLTQETHVSYDTYDSVVVAAETEEQAIDTRPDGQDWAVEKGFWNGWAFLREQVTVKLIGVAAEGIEAGVVIASFNAG